MGQTLPVSTSAGASVSSANANCATLRPPLAAELDVPCSPPSGGSPGRRRSAGQMSSSPQHFGRRFLLASGSGSFSSVYEPTGERELGRGSFGWVERCRHRPTGQLRALKHVSKRGGAARLRAVRHEVKVLQVLDHPNVVRLYEVFEDSRNLYLCMELCDGGELEDRIGREAHISERTVAVIMRQLISAVHYLHAIHHLAHRDIKTANCVLVGGKDSPLEECEVKLIDFGIACRCGPGETLQDGVGTAAYMAPEVWGDKYGLECDIWSLGLVLHELLCGRLPYACDANFSGRAWDGVSADAKEVVAGMLIKDPAQRWSLERCLEHRWIKHSAPCAAEGQLLHSDVVSNMRRYARSSVLRKAALQLIATRMDEKEIHELENVFMQLDTNHDGVLSLKELRAGLPQTLTPGDLQRLFDELDTDGDGFLEYTEFLAAAIDVKRYLQEDAVWAAFQRFDQDGNGRITTDELRKVFAAEGGGSEAALSPFSAGNVEDLIAAADQDGDGTVKFNEFIELLRTVPAVRAQAAVESSNPRKRPAAAGGVYSKKRPAAHSLSARTVGASHFKPEPTIKKRPAARASAKV